MKKLWRPLWPAAVVLVLAILARYLWIEPPVFRELCDPAGPMPWWCELREALIATFAFGGLGYVSVTLGICSVIVRRAWIAVLALCVSLAGLVLYSFDYSAVGLLLAALTLARLTQPPQPPVGPQHSGTQKQA